MGDIKYFEYNTLEKLSQDNLKKELYKALVNIHDSWMYASDIIFIMWKRNQQYGGKIIEKVSSDLNITRSYAFDLLKINRLLLSTDSSLREYKNLRVSHFILIVRNLKKIENPIDILKKASEMRWSCSTLASYISANRSILSIEKIEKTNTPQRGYKFYKEVKQIDDEIIKTIRINKNIEKCITSTSVFFREKC